MLTALTLRRYDTQSAVKTNAFVCGLLILPCAALCVAGVKPVLQLSCGCSTLFSSTSYLALHFILPSFI